MLWRQVRAIGLLPAISTGVVPALLLLIGGTDVGWDWDGAWSALPVIAGAALILAGLGLMYRTITLFARVGEGTLAPWDPPVKFVVAGPYRYVRNPMIIGVLAVIAGEAILFGSPVIAVFAGAFFITNAIAWFPFVEERALVRRFGREYEEYRRNVPAWIPRRTPWTPPGERAA